MNLLEKNTRDVVPELREHARIQRIAFNQKQGTEGHLLVGEIAANELVALRAEVERLKRNTCA